MSSFDATTLIGYSMKCRVNTRQSSLITSLSHLTTLCRKILLLDRVLVQADADLSDNLESRPG